MVACNRVVARALWVGIALLAARVALAAPTPPTPLPGDRQTLYFSPSDQSPAPQGIQDLTDPRKALEILFRQQAAASNGGPALDMQQKMLDMARGSGDVGGQIRALDRMGTIHARSGELGPAEQKLGEALKLAGAPRDAMWEANVRNDWGVVAAARGRFDEALRSLDKARTLYAALLREPPKAPRSSSVYGLTAASAQADMTSIGAQRGLTITLANLGAIRAHLGQFDEAVKAYEEANRTVGGQQVILQGLAATYSQLSKSLRAGGDAKKASEQAHMAEDYARQADAPSGTRDSAAAQLDPATMALFSDNHIELGAAGDMAGGPPQSLAASGIGGLQAAQSTLSQQVAIADAQARQARAEGRFDDAIAGWRKASLIATGAGLVDGRRNAYVQLQAVAVQAKRPELSAYFGKRAVAAIQQQREAVAAFGSDQRNAFATGARPVYEQLAATLMDLGRLDEAGRVLDLMRNDVVGGFVAIDDALPDDAAERTLAAHDESLAAQWRDNEASLAALRRDKPYSNVNLSDEEMGGVNNANLDIAENLLESSEHVPPAVRVQMAGMLIPRIHAVLDPELAAASCGGAVAPVSPRAKALGDRLAALERSVGGASAGRTAGIPGLSGFPMGMPPSPAATPADTARISCLQHTQVSILAAFAKVDDASLRGLAAPPAFSAADRASLDLERTTLARAGAPAVALHYLVGDHALRVLVTTASGGASHVVPMERATLQRLVKQLNDAMRDSTRDAQAPARALHAVLIAPALPDIDRVHAQTLLLSPDESLRDVPFAALHDGQRWLVERQAVVLADFGVVPARPKAARAWRVAAFGSTQGSGRLEALPAVEDELRAVVNDPAKGFRGVLPGSARLDRDFTARSLQEALAAQTPVVHIASHFQLDANGPADSWLLLGDGNRLTLQQLRQGYRFDGVDLLVLSACQTALDEHDGIYGQRFEGLAGVLRSQGAGAVVATLWKVNDASTSVLMRALYETHEQKHLTRAEALRAAQRALIDGAGAAAYAHPHFWAPFVLMGAWQ